MRRCRSPHLPTRTALALALAIIAGCSAFEPTPMIPTYPAPVGGPDGVSWELDVRCRNQSYRLAERTRRANLNREVGYTLIGIAAGIAIGGALSYDVEPRHPPHGHHGGYPYHGDHRDYRGAGAVAGATSGAVLSQGALQDPQRTYDVVYENCIRNNWGYGR